MLTETKENQQIVSQIHFGMMKRMLPSTRQLSKLYNEKFDSPISSWIPQDSIFRKPARSWSREKREKLKYYGISPKMFTRFIKQAHVTFYELKAVAELLDLEITITVTKK